MKRLFLLVLVAGNAFGQIGTQTVTDDFNRANETPLAGNWTQDAGNHFNLATNAVTTGTLTNDSVAYYNAWTSGDDQYSQVGVTSGANGGGAGAGPCVRKATSATDTYYRLVADSTGQFDLAKLVAGSYTSLRTGSVTYVAGQLLGLRIQGTTLQIWYNGVQIGTDVTDSSIASGAPGIAFSSNETFLTLDNWDAGTTGGAASPTPTPPDVKNPNLFFFPQ